ncbi:archaellin/type IV pilin N-terminal domain-containing protein [Haloarcula marina]|uniref:archaellin/type IV pilin N-terminal domain-containing protein n=1 Tax=Haloarcula marina TaxID=2961574 RepID=UPI0020B7FC51|nr:archaellin/type IV pilin N-terminal domain-containing protein [Halomicroarcula marina]
MHSANARREDERAQVGIGTLIVFIAMVLVAAIAAGVLINTAGFLQSSAQATGEGASDSTTNRLQIVSTTGDHFAGNKVGVVNITVKAGPGSGSVDLDKATVQWVGPTGSYYQLASGSSPPGPDGEFTISTVQDDDDSQPVVNDPEDRFTITLDLGASDLPGTDSADTFGNAIREGETATVRITTASGATTTKRIVVPQTLSGGSSVLL